MKDNFNNQFATQRLRENNNPGEEFIVNKVWDFLETKPFMNPDYMPKFHTAEEIYNGFDSEALKKYSEFDWKGNTEPIHHREKEALQRRANYGKLAGTSNMEETSATGGGDAYLPGLDVPKKKYKKEEKDVEPKLAAGKARVYAKNKWGWKEATSIPNRSSEIIDYKTLWQNKELNENYSRFKKETKTRTNEQQLHAAMRLAEKKIYEANRILEYTAQLRGELNETRTNKNTQKLMEKITRGIAEAYGKMKKLK